MRSPRVEKALDRYAAELRRRYGESLRDLWLFGSYARGQANEHSDVDVLVVLDRIDWKTRRDVIDLAADVGLEEEVLLSPTLFDTGTWRRWRRQERALAVDVEREGTRL
jgi:uncharacterized protein